jgi:CTP synthase
MQMAVVEFARHVCGRTGAESTEFDPETKEPVIDLMPDQRGVKQKGGTMRLGAYPCVLKEGSVAARIYGSREISERHRHRFEFNNEFRDTIQDGGMTLSGLSPDERLVEMVELSNHPHFVGCQFHPEFKSRPHAPHPLFTSFVRAAREQRDARATRGSKVEVKEASEPASSRAVH